MRGSKKCEPGCQCAKHTRSGNRGHGSQKSPVIDWNDPEARRAYNREKAREKYAANPEAAKDSSRRYVAKKRAEDPDYWRKYKRNMSSDLRYAHRITWEQLRGILDGQNGCCYLCTEPLDPEAPRGVHVDHDHQCCPGSRSCGNCIRGVSCHKCNTGIGLFGDDPDRMERVARNLRDANERLRSQVAPAGGD